MKKYINGLRTNIFVLRIKIKGSGRINEMLTPSYAGENRVVGNDKDDIKNSPMLQ